MIALDRARIVALARGFDRSAAGSQWTRGEQRLKARLARRRASGALYLTRGELCWVGEWKTPRIRPEIARNTDAGVRGLTAAAFLVQDDATRLRLLLGLRGVGVAVASVMLHFADPRRYPVYDVRVRAALGRIGVRRRFPPTAVGWMAYAAILRGLATRHRVSLRTLDKALWRLGGRRAPLASRPAASAVERVLPCRCRGGRGEGTGVADPTDAGRTTGHPRGERWASVTSSRTASSRSRSIAPRP